MSTQDDPENLPWQNSELKLRGVLHPPKPNSPIQFYTQNVIPQHWLDEEIVGPPKTILTQIVSQLANDGTASITPATGSIIMNPQKLEGNVSDTTSVQAASESHPQSSYPKAPEGVDMTTCTTDSDSPVEGVSPDWLEDFSRFIPKEFKDGWLGDLREEREKWRTERRSRPYIEWRTGVQIFFLALSKLSTIIGWIFRIYTQMSGWLMHNK